jgi:uncharacterized protein (TIGR02611 family)
MTSKHQRLRDWIHQQHPAFRITYKAILAIVGFSVVLAGIAMLVLPGPGVLTILAGLALLGLEFPFIHRFNSGLKEKAMRLWRKVRPVPSH